MGMVSSIDEWTRWQDLVREMTWWACLGMLDMKKIGYQ